MTATARKSFHAIKAEMARRIAERVWAPGALIPGEEVLSIEFGCARATVNRALQELARGGVLVRKRKAGTRVALHPMREARFVIPIVRQEIETKGGAYQFRLLSNRVEKAPTSVAQRMGLSKGKEMLHVQCVHLSNGKPYQYEDRWINLDAVPSIRNETFETISPNEWLVTHSPFSQAEIVFHAGVAGTHEAEILGVAEKDAVFIIERVTFVPQKPITFVRMIHPSSHRMVTQL
ncbi:GntR family transcriptional regulator [Phyllobacterium sp. 628]|uniref:GntR family transcriptional regulator n=1 Tax=Phyllobacterium sp. 628 TaxID=2718938 RepID=UPI001FCF17B5|nr:GntR family transcriptional regulator [Phyllobacterium sp. 628]